jgi:hydrogenase maturation protein HypF
MCDDCRAEYSDPADRRFHAEPIACPRCGPRMTLSTINGRGVPATDAIAASAALIAEGRIVAVKVLGGFHLACDATNAAAIDALRRRKRRFGKPFAVMMPDLAATRRYCAVGGQEAALLKSAAAPTVLLRADGPDALPAGIAAGLTTLGVMLPSTPLHHLLMQDLARPAVMTSGNLSEEPQCIDGAEVRVRLAGIADFLLDQDRPIAARLDDSVARVLAGGSALMRRARGYAPTPLPLPDGCRGAPPVIAMRGELKSTFCLAAEGRAVLSQHLGDLEEARTFDEYRSTLDAWLRLFDHHPRLCAVDLHPEYLSRKLGEGFAAEHGCAIVAVQHHHAHIAACLADNCVPLDTAPVIGIALDGLGWGDDGTIWGGEFLLADYRRYRRLASLTPVAMPGGARAVREPWRNTVAHLLRWMPQREVEARWAERPVATIAAMIRSRTNAPLASSCGRLFDAVAAAVDIAADVQSYEGEAASALEALAGGIGAEPYAFGTAADATGLPRLDPQPMWRALLDDLECGTPAAVISARFHAGFAAAIADLALTLRRTHAPEAAIALSGGSFQNALLLEGTRRRLLACGARVLLHARVPANDGGLALGQAAIAIAQTC